MLEESIVSASSSSSVAWFARLDVEEGFSATEDCCAWAGVRSALESEIFLQNKKINFSFSELRYSLDFRFYSEKASFFKFSPIAFESPMA